MGETRVPYNPAYCKVVKCLSRQGNKCKVAVCTHNHKRIIYWEKTGVILNA